MNANPTLKRILFAADFLASSRLALDYAAALDLAKAASSKKPHRVRVGLLCLCRRSPNLPHTYACSTIGPTRLNFRVRDGNGCDPRSKLTGKLRRIEGVYARSRSPEPLAAKDLLLHLYVKEISLTRFLSTE